MNSNRKAHWEGIYSTKQPTEVSWWQTNPRISLDFIQSFGLPLTANIIDVGGGDSTLVDALLAQGYENVTVLDISAQALERAQRRLAENSKRVRWVVSDITEFHADTAYDLWHDRAMFHFLSTEQDVTRYLSVAQQAVKGNGYIIIGTFSTTGPSKCSGLDVKQQNEETLTEQLKNGFEKIRCITEDHTTPFNTTQNFLFCSFRRRGKRVTR